MSLGNFSNLAREGFHTRWKNIHPWYNVFLIIKCIAYNENVSSIFYRKKYEKKIVKGRETGR